MFLDAPSKPDATLKLNMISRHEGKSRAIAPAQHFERRLNGGVRYHGRVYDTFWSSNFTANGFVDALMRGGMVLQERIPKRAIR